MIKLSTYFRSSAAYRVRLALNLKGLAYEPDFVHLVRDGGEQHMAAYRARNPAGLVPTMDADDGMVLTQSLAIIEWLEETHPRPALLPEGPAERAAVRAFALAVACDIHPLNNLRVLRYLREELGADKATVDGWYVHWLRIGLPVLEAMLERRGDAGPFCFGAAPGLADVCLVPQLANARRYALDLTDYPLLVRAEAAAMALPAFQRAAPDAQPDAG